MFKWRPLQSVEIVQTNQIFFVLTHSLHNNLKNLLFHFREFEYLNQKKIEQLFVINEQTVTKKATRVDRKSTGFIAVFKRFLRKLIISKNI